MRHRMSDTCDDNFAKKKKKIEQSMYRGGNKGMFVLLSRTQAGPGRTVKQEQEDISRNHVQTFISPSVGRSQTVLLRPPTEQ